MVLMVLGVILFRFELNVFGDDVEVLNTPYGLLRLALDPLDL